MNALQTLTEIEEEGKFYNSFCEASIFLIPKPDNDITGEKKKNLGI